MTRANLWKYSTIGLLGAVALALSLPEASAHVTNSVSHVLSHVFDNTEQIRAKTDHLPPDPASQSSLDSQLGNIQADTDDIQVRLQDLPSPGGNPAKAVLTNVALNPPDGTTQAVTIIAAQPGKMFHGHINGSLAFVSGTTGTFSCAETGGFGTDLASGGFGANFRTVNSDFVCSSLQVTATDLADGIDAGGGNIVTATIYFETSDIVEITGIDPGPGQ